MNRRQLLLGAAGAAFAVPATAAVARAATGAGPATAAATGVDTVSGVTSCTPRYLGYREVDKAKPWAGYFTGHTRPVQPQVKAAYDGPVTPASRIAPLTGLVDELNGSGAADVETGYGKLDNGTIWVACSTDMPGVTAEMWDWWFGWHLTESSRYKLWHPDAHEFASVTVKPGRPKPGPRSAYVGQTSYVDELIGPYLQELAIGFRDPVAPGFKVSADTTVVYGRVGSSAVPLDLGWVAHQVRPVPGGSQMRSRFYLNDPGLRSLDLAQAACAVARGPFEPLKSPLPFNTAFGKELMLHCGQEMNHLAGFLPQLHEEFFGTY